MKNTKKQFKCAASNLASARIVSHFTKAWNVEVQKAINIVVKNDNVLIQSHDAVGRCQYVVDGVEEVSAEFSACVDADKFFGVVSLLGDEVVTVSVSLNDEDFLVITAGKSKHNIKVDPNPMWSWRPIPKNEGFEISSGVLMAGIKFCQVATRKIEVDSSTSIIWLYGDGHVKFRSSDKINLAVFDTEEQGTFPMTGFDAANAKHISDIAKTFQKVRILCQDGSIFLFTPKVFSEIKTPGANPPPFEKYEKAYQFEYIAEVNSSDVARQCAFAIRCNDFSLVIESAPGEISFESESLYGEKFNGVLECYAEKTSRVKINPKTISPMLENFGGQVEYQVNLENRGVKIGIESQYYIISTIV